MSSSSGRGRKPKPTRLRELQGNPGKRRLPQGEPVPAGDMPPMPRGLLWDEAQRLWRKNAGALNEVGLLTTVDGPAFALMCQHYAIAVEAATRIRADGMMLVDENSQQRKHPLLSVWSSNSTLFKSYAVEFGMTPSARARLDVKPGEEQLTLADVLFNAVEAETDEQTVNR